MGLSGVSGKVCLSLSLSLFFLQVKGACEAPRPIGPPLFLGLSGRMLYVPVHVPGVVVLLCTHSHSLSLSLSLSLSGCNLCDTAYGVDIVFTLSAGCQLVVPHSSARRPSWQKIGVHTVKGVMMLHPGSS